MDIKGIREQFELFKTQRERKAMRKVVPLLIERALDAESPDRAIRHLGSFFTTLGAKETYLTGLMERKELQEGIIKIFSLSTYLTRVFLSRPRYLDLLLEGNIIRKTFKRTCEELERIVSRDDLGTGIAEYKNIEEIRLGSFFLMRVMKIRHLLRCLSHLADAVIGTITSAARADGYSFQRSGFSVLAMGKLGGREMTFGSDLDIIFLSENPDDIKVAERVLKALTAYTDKGIIYSVDMRLRPDGAKGALLKDMEGYRDYYLESAHPWELQALLKVRPVAGDAQSARVFMEMAKEVILKRGEELKRDDIRAMRERIVKELSQESKGIDVKLGPGGIEEIEFYVQALQINHARRAPEILVQDTTSAIRRLAKKSILAREDEKTLSSAYEYLRTLETFMRLNEEHVIAGNSEFAGLSGIFMGHRSNEEFLEHLNTVREKVLEIVQKRGSE